MLGFLAAPAQAASECGIDGAGADTITCTAASFPNGITYAGSDGLNLILDNSAMTVAKGTATDGVNLSGSTANDITFTATNLTSIDGGTGTAITVNNGGDGKAAIIINAGTLTAASVRTALATHTSGAGDSIVTLNGGTIANTYFTASYSLDALNSGTATGNATVLMTGGTVQSNGNTGSFLLHAQISNAASAGTASVTMTGGTVTGAGTGAAAFTNGSGLAQVLVDGATITSTGNVGAFATNTGSGDATVRVNNSSVASGNVFTASGLRAVTTSGAALASATNSSITSKGPSGAAISAQSSTGSATASMSGGSINNTANNVVGIKAQITGASTAAATVLLDGGTVTTSGSAGHGLYAQATNGQAVAHMTDGIVTVTGNNADALFATTSGTGAYDINVSGGTLTGGPGTGAAIHANATNGGTIAIGANAIVNAGASGVALNVAGGAATITSAGALTGNINLSNAAHQFTVTGGTIAGNINGGGASTLAFDLGGTESFTYAAPYTITAFDTVAMVSGTANINGTVNANSLAVHGGTMNLNAAPAFASQVTVDGGLLAVNTTLTAPTMTVQNSGIVAMNGTTNAQVTALNGGTLRGNGTVGATTIQSGGIIAPGNSIGTLHINGAFAQNAGSIYQVEVDPTSNASDLVLVNGAATIAGGATINVTKNPPGSYRLDAQYTVLTASGGVTGNYTAGGDTAVSQYLALHPTTDANNVYLRVVQTGDPASAATTPNQAATATATDGLPATSGVGSAVLNTPDTNTTRAAFDALSGEALASAKGVLISSSVLVRDTTFDRLRDVLCTDGGQDDHTHRTGCVASDDKPSLWVQGFGDWGHTFGTANAAGVSQTTGGFLTGVDIPVSDWRLGIFGGYSRTDFNATARASAGASDTYHLGAYGGTVLGDVQLRLGGSYSWSGIDTERLVAFDTFTNDLRASYNAGTAQVFGEIGRAFQLDRVSLEPFANIAYVGIHTKGFSETGGDAALTSRPDTTQDVFATFGVRPSTEIEIGSISAVLRGMAGWRHTFGDITPSSLVSFAGSTAFTVTGAPIAKEAGVVEAGISANLSDQVAIGLTYGGQFSDRQTDHGIRGTLAITF